MDENTERLMQEEHDRRMENISITYVSGFYTLSYDVGEDKVQCLVMPTDTLPDESYSRFTIDKGNGNIKLLFDSAFLKDTAILESESDMYRMAVHHNANAIFSMSHTPGMEFGAEAELFAWAESCSANKLRMFVGGDVCCADIVYCAANVAGRLKDKTIAVTSCNIDVLNKVFAETVSSPLPDNFMLFLERPFAEKLCFACFPDVLYSEDGGCCGDLAWWPEAYEGCKIHINARSGKMVARMVRTQGAPDRPHRGCKRTGSGDCAS